MSSMDHAEPACRVLRSSEGLGWIDVLAERRSHDAGAWHTPALDTHMLCLYQGPPLQLAQRREGRQRCDWVVDGMVQIVPAGLSSDWIHGRRADFVALQLSTSLLARLRWPGDDGQGRRLELGSYYGLRDRQLSSLMQALALELQRGGVHGPMYAESIAVALGLVLLRGYGDGAAPAAAGPPALSRAAMRRVLEYMHASFASPIGLKELAALAGLSASHFSNCFRRSIGLPPYEYLIRLRLAQAQRLLRSERVTLADVAARCGFYDQSHLARHSRRLLGVSPRQLAEAETLQLPRPG